ncbi:MAG: amidohydrolase, partial [Woeseiaceae bacterium]
DVKGAYLFLGTADHNIFKQAQEDGHEFPFFVHEPNYQVSLDAIPFGAKVASVLAIEILQP